MSQKTHFVQYILVYSHLYLFTDHKIRHYVTKDTLRSIYFGILICTYLLITKSVTMSQKTHFVQYILVYSHLYLFTDHEIRHYVTKDTLRSIYFGILICTYLLITKSVTMSQKTHFVQYILVYSHLYLFTDHKIRHYVTKDTLRSIYFGILICTYLLITKSVTMSQKTHFVQYILVYSHLYLFTDHEIRHYVTKDTLRSIYFGILICTYLLITKSVTMSQKTHFVQYILVYSHLYLFTDHKIRHYVTKDTLRSIYFGILICTYLLITNSVTMSQKTHFVQYILVFLICTYLLITKSVTMSQKTHFVQYILVFLICTYLLITKSVTMLQKTHFVQYILVFSSVLIY